MTNQAFNCRHRVPLDQACEGCAEDRAALAAPATIAPVGWERTGDNGFREPLYLKGAREPHGFKSVYEPRFAAPASAQASEPSDGVLIDLASDFQSTYQHCGTTFDRFDSLGFARAVLALATQAQAPAAPSEKLAGAEVMAFINVIKGAAFAGPEFFTQKRCRQMFEECVRLESIASHAQTVPQAAPAAAQDEALVRAAERVIACAPASGWSDPNAPDELRAALAARQQENAR